MIYLLLLLQQTIASSTHLVVKSVTNIMHPADVVLMRGFFTCMSVLLVLLIRRSKWIKPETGDLKLILFLGFMSVTVNQVLFIWGLRFTTPPNAALAYALTPVFVILLGLIFLRQKVSNRTWLGVGLAMTGAAIVLIEKGARYNPEQTLGNIIVLVASLSWGAYTLFSQPLISKYGAVQASAMTFLSGVLMYLPIWALLPVDSTLSVLQGPSGSTLLFQLFYLGVVTSTIGYGLWFFALTKLPSSRVAVFNNLQPILTSLLAMVLLGTEPTVSFIIGGSMALAGVVITQRS